MCFGGAACPKIDGREDRSRCESANENARRRFGWYTRETGRESDQQVGSRRIPSEIELGPAVLLWESQRAAITPETVEFDPVTMLGIP